MAEVLITVRPDGKTTVEAEGWTGPTCAAITEPYRKALGHEIGAQNKPEFYESDLENILEISQEGP